MIQQTSQHSFVYPLIHSAVCSDNFDLLPLNHRYDAETEQTEDEKMKQSEKAVK